jgi:hypothetical protein
VGWGGDGYVGDMFWEEAVEGVCRVILSLAVTKPMAAIPFTL